MRIPISAKDEPRSLGRMEGKTRPHTHTHTHLIIDPIPGGAILIVYDNRDGRRRGRSRRPQRRTSRCLTARLLRREIIPRYRTLSIEGAPGPPEANDVRADDGGGPWPPLPPGESGGHGPKVLDGL